MSEKFACTNCRMLLEVDSDQQGKQVRCPVCGLISVFGSPIESGHRGENTDDWSPVSESRQPATPDREERKPIRDVFRGLKSSPQTPEGDWQEVRPTPSIPAYARDASKKPRADKFVIDETQVANNQSRYDRYWKIGFVLSLLSLVCFVSYPFCICCLMHPIGPPVPLVLGFFGIRFTSKSQRGPKELNYLLAGLGIAISLLTSFMWVILLFVG